MRSTLCRRGLLAALGSAAALLPPLRGHALLVGPDPAARLIGLFEHRASAQAIGAVYLAGQPQEADARKLVELIVRPENEPLVIHHMTDTELRAWFRERLVRDFATDRIVNVDGWLLAAIEVRVCALAALV
jgi:hypothetical protein